MEGFNGLLLSISQLSTDEMQCSFLQKCPAKRGDSLITPAGAIIPVARDSNNLPFFIGTILYPLVVTVESSAVTSPAIANKVVSLSVLSSTEALSEHMKYGCIPFVSLVSTSVTSKNRSSLSAMPCLSLLQIEPRSVVKSESSEHISVVNFGLWGSDYKPGFVPYQKYGRR